MADGVIHTTAREFVTYINHLKKAVNLIKLVCKWLVTRDVEGSTLYRDLKKIQDILDDIVKDLEAEDQWKMNNE